MKDFAIKNKDYKRIFETIYSTIKRQDEIDITKSCINFSIIGAMILQKHYKLDAKICMGMASYCFDDMKCLTYGEQTKDQIKLSRNNFHAWIVVDNNHDGWIIDFSCPIFPLIIKKELNQEYKCPSTAFQRKISSMAQDGSELKKRGDFYLYHDLDMTKKVVEKFTSRPYNTDTVSVCLKWYKKPHLNMKKNIDFIDTKTGYGRLTKESFRIVGNFE